MRIRTGAEAYLQKSAGKTAGKRAEGPAVQRAEAVWRTPEISEGGASGSDAPFRGVCLGGEAGKRGGPSAVGRGIALVRAAPLWDARLVCVPFVAPDFNKRFF